MMQTDLVAAPEFDESSVVESAIGAARSRRPSRGRRDLFKALLSIGDQAVFSGTSFVSAVIIGRASSADNLGLYYLTLTIAFIAIGIQEALISSPFTIFSNAKRGRDLREFTGSAWLHYLGLSLLFSAILVGAIAVTAAPGIAESLPASLREWIDAGGLALLLFVLPLLLLREAIRRFAFARLELNVAIALDVTVSAVQLAGLLAIARLDRMSIVTIFSVMGAACALACLGWLFLQRQTSRVIPSRAWRDWKQNWPFASWSLYSYVVGSTIPFIMPWIVTSLVSTAAAGLFGAASTLVGVTNILVLGGGNFLTPKAAESFAVSGSHGLRRVLCAAAMIFALLIGTFLLTILVTGDWLAVLLFKKEEFRGCGPLLAALTTNVLMGSLGMIAVVGLWVLGKQRSNFAIDVVVFASTIVSALCLVPTQGAFGAAVASLVGATIGTSIRAVLLHRALAESSQMASASAVATSEQSSLVAG